MDSDLVQIIILPKQNRFEKITPKQNNQSDAHALSRTAGQCRLAAVAAAALVLHEVALAGGVALEAGGAGGDLAVARRLGAAPALHTEERASR